MVEKKMNPLVSLIGGIVMTLLLVVAVPVITTWLIEPIITDLIDDISLDWVVTLSSATIGAIVMFIVMVLFLILLGGGAILKRFGAIGIVGLILAYYFLLDDPWGWIIPVAIVIVMWLYSRRKDQS